MKTLENKNFIAKKIKLARKKQNLTQSELAEKIGISPKQLSRIEIGSFMPSLPTFLKIINILNIDIKEFNIIANPKKNNLLNELIKIIYTSDDKQLKLYLEIIKILANTFDAKN